MIMLSVWFVGLVAIQYFLLLRACKRANPKLLKSRKAPVTDRHSSAIDEPAEELQLRAFTM